MSSENNENKLTYDPVKEVRFAMVLNGGVSLAIYINGITQELFKLVRATAPKKEPTGEFPTQTLVPTDELKGTERVYRKLGQFLSSDKCKLSDIDFDSDPIRTRFVIDIISGTSAGGINGVFLAKALANQQEMKPLEALWVDEGDIEKLINDHRSVKGLSQLPVQDPPGSLLNSQRMYYKLLEALEKMESEGELRSDGNHVSPYVEELDLYVTASDNEGLLLRLKLEDRVVYEKRHRNVFHFMYATDEVSSSTQKPEDSDKISVSLNDFQAKNNPFLAFAARCTSSFPFAFEPMRLCDIDPVLEKFSSYKKHLEFYGSSSPEWQKFYKDYRSEQDGFKEFPKRAFSDGGELDNIPFGYAINALNNRRADVPVDRKLIYIDPSPPHPELEKKPISDSKPNAIENVAAALFTLPRTETIREDVERIKERNRLINRWNRITLGIEHLDVVKGEIVREKEKSDWVERDLREMIRSRGLAFGGYYRLKVGAVTDDLAELITRVAGFYENSDQERAIQYLVRAWRDTKYEIFKEEGSKKSTQNRFLLNFDFSYRLRRLNFLQKKLNQLYSLNRDDTLLIDEIAEITKKNLELDQISEEKNKRILRDLKIQLGKIYQELRAAGRQLRSRSKDNLSPLTLSIQATGLNLEQLSEILLGATEKQRLARAKALIEKKLYEFNELEVILGNTLQKIFVKASEQCEEILNPKEIKQKIDTFKGQVCKLLQHYYSYYEDYDMILFPIMHSADLGEADEVEIIRISPEDSTKLINEQKAGFRKLSGTAFGNFGAFLDRTWRENDILWGRLDAAERIIKTLLVEHPDMANELIEEALGYILLEEIQKSKLPEDFHRKLIQPFVKIPEEKTIQDAQTYLQQFVKNIRKCIARVTPSADLDEDEEGNYE